MDPAEDATTEALDLGERTVRLERGTFHPLGLALVVLSAALLCLTAAAVAPLLALLLYVVPPLVWYFWAHTRDQRSRVRVEGDALVLSSAAGERRIRRAEVRSAYTSEDFVVDSVVQGVLLTLENRATVFVPTRSPEEGDGLLRALGFDVRQRRAEFRAVRVFHRLLSWMLGPTAALLVTIPILKSLPFPDSPLSFFAVFMPLLWFFVRLARPRLDVVIGLDGMTVGGRLGRRFIPWDDVAAVTEGAGEFQLHFKDGRRKTVWCNPDDWRLLSAVVARCQDALEAWRRAAGASDPISALDRSGRELPQWREDLRKLLHAVGDYRTAALSRERVEAVLADPSTSVERRIAAALALADAPGDEGRARVRIAADVCANETERAALAHIAEGAEGVGPVERALDADKSA